MKQGDITAINHEPRRADISLDHVFEFWASIFEAGRGVFDDSFAENFIKIGSFDFLMASRVNFGGELEKLSDICAGFARS